MATIAPCDTVLQLQPDLALHSPADSAQSHGQKIGGSDFKLKFGIEKLLVWASLEHAAALFCLASVGQGREPYMGRGEGSFYTQAFSVRFQPQVLSVTVCDSL